MAARVPPPTEEEIALRAREIRRGWSPRETERRCAYKTKVVYAPVSENQFTDRTTCCSEFRAARRIMRLN
jgi:hypothetical protein